MAPTDTYRTGLFYDVFDTHFVLNSPKRYEILKILIKNVIKQPGLVLCRSGPVRAGQGRSGLIGTGTTEKPQETLRPVK
jgi:hypothetical protein